MKYVRYVVLFAVLLVSACGAEPAANAPTAQPSAAPTEELFVSAGSAPQPSPPSSSSTATVEPQAATATLQSTAVPEATAGPTERMILPAATDEPTLAAPTAAAVAADATEEPAAQAAPGNHTAASQPVRLTIKDIGVDDQLQSVGLDKQRIPIVPKHDIGWYNLSAMPGQGENIVLWGHVLRFRDSPKIPAPFARLKELKPGAAVVLYDKAGTAHDYVVTQQIWVTPDQVEYILPRGKEMVTMVSCIGDKIITNGEVVDESHRLITIAEPAA
jgi:sortase (surface protein transpeptidase)